MRIAITIQIILLMSLLAIIAVILPTAINKSIDNESVSISNHKIDLLLTQDKGHYKD